jgi:C4-dicarboxylate-binding protein DctP
MYEVQKYMTLTDHGYLGYVVITNKKFWQGLPAGVRRQLDRAMKEATIYANSVAQLDNASALAKIRASGTMQIHVPTAEERQELKRAMLRTHAEMAARIGRETIEAIYRETGFDPSDLD